MTVHKGMRDLPDEVPAEDVEEHSHLGEVLERSDVRKYLPQSREGNGGKTRGTISGHKKSSIS